MDLMSSQNTITVPFRQVSRGKHTYIGPNEGLRLGSCQELLIEVC